MALPDLHKFADDLLSSPGPGSAAPPRSIKAVDLDDNYRKVTVIQPPDNPPAYKVQYTKDGTILTDIAGLPPDATARQLYVVINGSLQQMWFVTWDTEPELPDS